MPLTRGTPTVANSTSGSAIVAKPSVSVGDVIIFLVMAQSALSNLPIPPASVTTIADSGSGNFTIGAYYRKVDGTEGSTFQFDGPSNAVHAVAIPYSGVDAVVVDVAAALNATATGVSETHAAVTTVTDNADVLAWTYTIRSGANDTVAAPTNFTRLYDRAVNTNSRGMVAAWQKSPAGSTGTITWPSSGSSHSFMVGTVAIRPSTASPNRVQMIV